MRNFHKKILVTGGAGFVGGHFCEAALEKGYDVVIIDIFNNETSDEQQKATNINHIRDAAKKNKSKLKVYQCSITDEDSLNKIFIDEKPNILVHSASLVMDRMSMNIPLDFIDTNIRGSQILINASSNVKSLEQIIFISSRSAVGEVPDATSLMAEDSALRPINPYGATKAAAEGFFYSNHHNTKLPLKICRMQPMYGPRGRDDMFVKRILNSIITGEEIQKYGTGEAVRDWLYISDATDGLFAVLEFDVPFEIFNIGIGKATSTNELIELCESITGLKANIKNVDLPPGDAHFTGIADCSKMKEMLGWRAKTEISEGIQKTYDYMVRQHEAT
ncbi:SDR family NAD(P)-dependent oxidoreductase [Amylibacter sp.]|nr:SDR family NAD(P)-dependent oxidoreductase [Amylibacter sp.]